MTASDEMGIMAQAGYYDTHSQPQHDASAVGLDLLAAAAADVPLPARGPLLVADLGAAQGENSLRPITTALDVLARRLGPHDDRPMVVVHTDLPGNDWTTLFHVLDTDPGSYLRHRPDVSAYVAGRSFYDRIFPPSTITVAWTSSTLHWLRVDPGPIADHFFVQSSTDAAARDRYRRQSEQDWRDFLAARAAELRPGASVVFVDTVMGDDGVMGGEALFDAVQAAIVDAHRQGRLTDAQFAALAYPTWFRTVAELRAPLATTDERSAGDGLELLDLETATLTDPYWAAYERSGDRRAFAEAQIDFVRGFLERSFTAELASTTTPGDRPPDLAPVWASAVDAVAADPARSSPRWRLVRARIRRVAEQHPSPAG